MRTFLALTLALGLFCGAAAATLIDFEAYADAQNLNGINLGGVTLTNPVNGIVEVYDNRFGLSYHSATKVIGSFSGCQSVNPIVGEFDELQGYVSLWAGDGGIDVERWSLEAFDANWGSLGVVFSDEWDGSPYTQLRIDAVGIKYFKVCWLGNECGIGFDDLEFGPAIPEPGTLMMLGAGMLSLAGLAGRRRIRI